MLVNQTWVPLSNSSSGSSWPFAFWFVPCCAHVRGGLEYICASKLLEISLTLMLVPGAVFKQNGGNKIMAPPV